ncbi:hypothetical protein F2Q68_00030833 [Brassica cretica]|uniref:Uncharacterized protein n=1 Tax=Brassica cretica TaxID=69181 RepID=A0A8S9G9S4_BRACR|nr:hypothetical protein F2Q68_00030833 [Brassica cretica]
MEKTSQDDRSAPVQIHPSWLCPRRKGSAHGRDDQQGPRDVLQRPLDVLIGQVAFQLGKYELQFGQFNHLVVDLAEAPIRTFAAGTRPDWSVWSGRKSKPQLGRLEHSDLHVGLIPRTSPWTGAHHPEAG